MVLVPGEYPTGWEKKVKVMNLSIPAKKGFVSRSAKLKSAKRGDDSFETCSDIFPYEGGFPSIGNIVFKGSPSPPPPFYLYLFQLAPYYRQDQAYCPTAIHRCSSFLQDPR